MTEKQLQFDFRNFLKRFSPPQSEVAGTPPAPPALDSPMDVLDSPPEADIVDIKDEIVPNPEYDENYKSPKDDIPF